MAKIISISNKLYEKLTKMKGDKSYSVTIEGLIEESNNKERLLSFFGKGGVDEKKVKAVRGEWKKWSKKFA